MRDTEKTSEHQENNRASALNLATLADEMFGGTSLLNVVLIATSFTPFLFLKQKPPYIEALVWLAMLALPFIILNFMLYIAACKKYHTDHMSYLKIHFAFLLDNLPNLLQIITFIVFLQYFSGNNRSIGYA